MLCWPLVKRFVLLVWLTARVVSAGEIQIGVEYAMPGMAETLAKLGVPALLP